MAWNDLETRRIEWTEENGNNGRREFHVPKADVDGYAASYARGVVWPGESGDGCNQIWKSEILRDAPGRAGMSLVIAHYKQPGWGAILEQNVNKGRLLLRIGGREEELVTDTAGKVIVGPAAKPDAGDKGSWVWKVYKGTNIVLAQRCVLVIDAGVDAINANTIMGLVNGYNSAQMTNIGNAAAKTLLFRGGEVVSTISDDPDDYIWRVQYEFWYDENGWDDQLKSARYRRYPKEVAVLDEDDAATGEFRMIMKEKHYTGDPDGASGVARDPFTSENFAVFNTMLDWT